MGNLFRCGGSDGATITFNNYNPIGLKKITSPEGLSVTRTESAATTVGNYALFGGGYVREGENRSEVDVYDSTLTHTTATDLSVARGYLAATTVGNYALFGGGYHNSEVDVYDSTLTHTTATDLSTARGYLAATTVGDYALFGGGFNTNSTVFATVDVYDSTLTHTTATDLSVARIPSATTVGNYALFGGGQDSNNNSSPQSKIDSYINISTLNLQIYPQSKYKLNSSTEVTATDFTTLTFTDPVTGYIKVKNITLS